MKRRIEILLALLMLSLPQLLSAIDIKEDFKYLKKTPPAGKKSDIARIYLDSDIYAATSDRLDDIRILDSQNTEMPFVIRADISSETETEYKYFPARIVSLKKLPENKLEVCIEIPGTPSPVISGLVLRTPSKNYEKQVSVDGSQDIATWKPLCAGQVIYDYSEVAPLANSTLKFKDSSMKCYRLTIANFTEDRKSPRMELISEKRLGDDFSRIEKMNISSEHLKIDEIGYLVKTDKVVKTRNKTMEVPTSAFSTREIEGKTELLFSASRVPLDHVVVQTSSTNFSRSFSISKSSDGKGWNDMPASGKLTSIDLSGYRETSLTVPLGGDRSSKYRITILNGNAPPLKISGIKAFGAVHFIELLNNKDGGLGGLSIYYGAVEAPSPSYDVAEVLEKLKNPTSIDLKPGAQIENPDFSKGVKPGRIMSSRTVFTVAVILMVILLSWILFVSFRKVDSIDNSQ